MTGAPLSPLDDYLARILARLPVAPLHRLAPAQAVGHVAAEIIVASSPLPRANTALRAGVALEARSTIGASPHAPAMLTPPPVSVAAGDELPDRCDAVADRQAVEWHGAYAEMHEQVPPGQNVRLAGHDLPQGGQIVVPGEWITPALALACELAQVPEISVYRPAIFLAPHPGPARAWLLHMLKAQGADCMDNQAHAALHIHWDGTAAPSLALAPGAGIAMQADPLCLVLSCPPRFDSAVALYAAILVPCLAAMTQRRIRARHVRIVRKISSAIGISDIVLLAASGDGMIPLAVGEITVEALLKAEAFAILAPHSEGLPAGEILSVTPLHTPLASAYSS